MSVGGSSYGQGEAKVDDDEVLRTRLELVQRHVHGQIPLTEVATDAGVSLRTARRWLARYRKSGPSGLQRASRPESGSRKFPVELVEFIEGLALLKPPMRFVTVHRRAVKLAKKKKWASPSYGTVRSIIRRLNPALVTLAHEGSAALRDKFEIVYRHRAECPNAVWQADHTLLDLMTLDANGEEVRPWLTTVIDDYSRAVAGYLVFYGAPSALNTSLALRQAIWRKGNPDWQVCGIPDRLYVDHGSDFTSIHLEQVSVDLRFEIIYSTVARPQGRGKVERLFRTINTELLSELPGHLKDGKPASSPRLSLPELDKAIGRYIVSEYNARVHSAIGETPLNAWCGEGWLPRMPDTLEELDSLLVMVARSRQVQRDGIRFEGLRFTSPTLAAYVGEPVTIRYDPRDMSEIRVFHKNAFLCRAISPKHAGQVISLKDIQAARVAHRKRLRAELKKKKARVSDYLPGILNSQVDNFVEKSKEPKPIQRLKPKKTPRLKTYLEED